MGTVWTLAIREYKKYFSSPAAYMVAFMFLLILGFLFYSNLTFAVLRQFPPGMDSVTGPLVFLLLFTTPAVTMHLMADEHRMGTIELLLTAPVRDWELVVGKWLGGFFFLLSLVAVTLVYPIFLNWIVEPGIDQGPLITSYLGLALVCSALVAVGVMISSFFKNQIAAFFTTLGVLLLLWIMSAANSSGTNELLAYLDFREHYFSTFLVGVIDIRDVIYYISLTIVPLLVGSIFVETRRWR